MTALQPLKSSMASHAGYDPATKRLTVKFHNGAIFHYDNVPHNIGETLLGSFSFGTAFNRHIAGKYTGRRG